MKKILFFIFLNIGYFLFSQVGIGTLTPRGILDLNSPTSNIYGLVLPTSPNPSNIQNPQGGEPPLGTILFDSSTNCLKFFEKVLENSIQDEQWSGCLISQPENNPSVSYVEVDNTFTGNYIQHVAMTSANTFQIAVTNPSFTPVPLNFNPRDVTFSGISGIQAASVSPTSVTLSPGQTQLLTYTLSGTPTGCGQLTAVWKKINLTYTNNTVVRQNIIYNCPQGSWTSPVTPEHRLTGLIPGQSYSGTYTIPYTTNGTANNCDLPPETITHRGLTLTSTGGPVSTSGTITYTLSGIYNGPADSGWALFTNSGGCEIYIGPSSSCKEILQIFPGSPSGVYKLNPDKQGTAIATQDAQCDMTTDGGGWTLMANYAVSYAAQPLAINSTTGLPTNSFNNKLPLLGTNTLGVNEVGNATTFGSGMAIISGFVEQPTEWRISGTRSTNNSTAVAATVNWKAPMTTAIRNSMIAGEAFTNSTLPTPLTGNTVTPTTWGNACCSAWGGRNSVTNVIGNDVYGFWIGYLQLHRTNASNNPTATRDNAIYRLWIR